MFKDINGNYTSVRVIPPQESNNNIQQSKVQPQEQSHNLHYDPAETLGRSQLLHINTSTQTLPPPQSLPQTKIQQKSETGIFLKIKNFVIKKFKSTESKILNNEVMTKKLDGIYLDKNRLKCADHILNNPKLFETESFVSLLKYIIQSVKCPEDADSKIAILKCIKANPELLKNKMFADNIGNILIETCKRKQADKVVYLFDKLKQNPEILNKIENQKQIVMKNPERYVNGEYKLPEDMQEDINDFFKQNYLNLLFISSVYDKEALNYLLRIRFNNAEEYIDIFDKFEPSQMELINKMCNSCNQDGKPFLPAQKISFIDIIQAYKDNKISLDKIKSMVKKGKIDIGALNFEMLVKIIKNAGLSTKEIASVPKEKLMNWDMKFIHLLSKEINSGKDKEAMCDIMRGANLYNFEEYIHSKSNRYGIANTITKQKFADLDMNYTKWLHPSKEHEINFVTQNNTANRLFCIAKLIENDINSLMETPLQQFLQKHIDAKYIKGNKFVLPEEYFTDKTKLLKLTKILSDTTEKGQLNQVWKRAQNNIKTTPDDYDRIANALKTLTILKHLKQRVEDISNLSNENTKMLDIKIKMWDRLPQKDIFQGNYSTCCIGMGQRCSEEMPYYLMNTVFNMIELVDNTTGKTIGNVLCYFVKDDNEKPIFVLDNIEVKNSIVLKRTVEGIQLRKAIADYAAKIAKEVTGCDDIGIFMSNCYNDVPDEDLPEELKKIKLVGDISSYNIYLDLFSGWNYADTITKEFNKKTMLKLR